MKRQLPRIRMFAPRKEFKNADVAVKTLGEFVFGRAPHPVACGRGLVCGGGIVLRPDVVLRLCRQILEESTPYRRTRRAILATLEELTRGHAQGRVRIAGREIRWLDTLRQQADELPEQEAELVAEMLRSPDATHFLPAEYGLDGVA